MVVAGCLAIALLVGATVYAGSSGTLADGETIAGLDVGCLSTKKATRLLEQRAAALGRVPVVVHAGASTFRFRQSEIGAEVDWPGAVQEAKSRADGFGPIRG